jgi:thiopurine S-methyltransferase
LVFNQRDFLDHFYRYKEKMSVAAEHLKRWEEGWASGRYSVLGQCFHKPAVHPLLDRFFTLLELRPGEGNQVLVPLCGKSVDMIYIADQRVNALGLEAISRPIDEFADLVQNEKLPADERVLHSAAQHHWQRDSQSFVGIVEGDALCFKSDQDKGPMDAVWDRAALVALRPEDREAYVAMLNRAVKPGGKILLCVVEHDITVSDEDTSPYGPPYSISADTVRNLCETSQLNVLRELYRQDNLESEPKWKGKGASYFLEVCYLLEKADGDN